MARLGALCIDRFEAHLVSRGPSGEIVRHAFDQRPAPGVAYEARSEGGAYPQAYINRPEAAAACRAAGKRLCTLAEWQRTCGGAGALAYPYGPRWKAGACNQDKPHLVTRLFGWDPRRWRYEDFNDPALDRAPGFLARAGEHPACEREGVMDLVGNLHEWVSDTVDRALLARLANDGVRRQWQPGTSGNGVFVGGFFSNHEEHGPGCRFITVAHEPAYHDYSTGFRCCADAPRVASAPGG
jgi:formylglycine-generating enzyme required for sulfatase activity